MRVDEVYEQNRRTALEIHRSSGSTVEARIGISIAHLQTNLGMRSNLLDLVNPALWRNRNMTWRNEVPIERDPYHLSGIELLYRALKLQPKLRALHEEEITSIGQQLFIVAEGLKALNKGRKERLRRVLHS